MRTTLSVLFVLAVAGCHDRTYVYSPQSANAYAAGIPAARTPIPEEQPRGSMQVTSHGITQLQQGNTRIPVLHVRLEVANDSDDQPWTLDTRKQVLEVPGLGLSVPTFASADAKTVPVIRLPPGARHEIDLFFQLPVNITSADDLRGFELHWVVNSPRQIIGASSTFERLAHVQPGEVLGYYDPSYSHWYHDPNPRSTLAGTRPVIVHDRHASAHVHRYAGYYRPAGQVAWR
jgi:hypothetical protein